MVGFAHTPVFHMEKKHDFYRSGEPLRPLGPWGLVEFQWPLDSPNLLKVNHGFAGLEPQDAAGFSASLGNVTGGRGLLVQLWIWNNQGCDCSLGLRFWPQGHQMNPSLCSLRPYQMFPSRGFNPNEMSVTPQMKPRWFIPRVLSVFGSPDDRSVPSAPCALVQRRRLKNDHLRIIKDWNI